MILFRCPQCGKEKTVIPAMAGLAVMCTSCSVRFQRVEDPGQPRPVPPPYLPPPPSNRLAEVVRQIAAQPPPAPPPQPSPPPPEPDLKLLLIPATRTARFFARLIDTALLMAVGSIGAYLGPIFLRPLYGYSKGESIGAGTGLAVLGFFLLNIILLATRGQDVGKLIIGIRIYRESGEQAEIIHAFVLRDGLNWFLGIIPVFGQIYGFVNACCIFGAERLCLHDRIAKTIVVNDPNRPNW